MRKNYVVITCLCLGLLLLGSSCGNKQTEETSMANVRLFMVKNTDTVLAQEFPGRVKAAEEVSLAFKLSGTLMNVCVEEGSKVSKGQLIAEIDPRDYQVQLDAVKAEYLSVKSEAERVMALYADSVSTADAYDKARYGLQQIAAKYENARNQLADTKIYSPFNGYVQNRLFDPPTVVAAGMPVVMLVSEGKQEIEINIPASTYVRRDEIASFSASFDFIPNEKIPLSLISIAPKANANQLYTVRLALPQGMSSHLSPGMNTMVYMEASNTADGNMEIPSTALFKKDEKSCVWVYNEKEGTIRLRVVSVKQLHTNGMAIIAQGLSIGEYVVSAGVHKLTDNQKVKPMAEDSETNVGGLL